MSKNNSVIIRPDTRIGNISAENDDEFLFGCFVDHPALAPSIDLNSPQMFLSGRTGAGKTAILRKIGNQSANSSTIDLQELSLDYIANSDIIRFLNSLDIDLDLFFQALWKHILCLEYVRMRFDVKSSEDSRNIFDRIANFFSKDERKSSALKYLKQWESKFWITMDENIREITSKLETQVDASLGVELQKFKTNAGYARTLSTEKKLTFHRAQEKL